MSLKSKKILFLCPYPQDKAPSQRLKFEQYFKLIEEEGFSVHFDSFFSDYFWSFLYLDRFYLKKIVFTIFSYFRRYLVLFSIRKYDIVYIHLWGTPIGIPLFEYLLTKMHKKIVYNIDDLIFLRNKSDANGIIAGLKGKSKSIFLMKRSNHVVTCTPYLDSFVRQYNVNTTDISSTVDTQKKYIPATNYKNDHQIIIGWSGSHSTSKYVYLLKEVLQELALEIDFKLIVMGDKSFGLDCVNIDAFEWSETIEIETLQKFDIGIYPLPFEDWVLGKSGLKAIQYMALGIPTVATKVGAIDRIIEHTSNGYLVEDNSKEEWKYYLKKLIEDHEDRKRIGLQARKTIENHYSLHVNAKKYIEILNFI